MPEDTKKNNTPWDRMNELQYQDVSTYLRAWYKGKKNDSPIELGSDLGFYSYLELDRVLSTPI